MSPLRARLSALAVAAAVGGAVLVPATAAQAYVPACGNSSLAVTHTQPQGATGHGSFVLLFRIVTGSTCSLYGYPGLDALDKYGHVLAHAQRTLHGFAGGATSVSTINVAPGGFASATVEWMNFNPVTSGPCAFSASVATTPANTSHTVHFPVSVSVCSLQVHPTVAGTSGNNAYAAAQAQWIAGSTAISAKQGIYWVNAKNDLLTAGSVFSAETGELQQLITLPDANQTPAQNTEWHQDVSNLNSFFGTPGLY